MFGPTTTDAGDPREVLHNMIAVRQAHDARVHSIELRYQFTLSWNYEPLPQHLRPPALRDALRHAVEKQGEYGQSGDKWYSIETFRALDEPAGKTRSHHSAFDGKLYRERSTLETPSFATTQKPGLIRPGTPEPRRMAELETPAALLAAFADGRIKSLKAVQGTWKGHNCLGIVAETATEPHFQVQIIFDSDRHFVPLARSLRHDNGGAECTVLYTELTIGGQKIFYPVQQSSTGHYAGQVTQKDSLLVDESSLRINQPIPDSRFTLNPEPGDLVHDDRS